LKKQFNYRQLLGENNPLLRFPALHEASLDEFSQKTYEEASLNDILKKGKMSKGSFYHHFGDKFGLYLAMLDLILKKKYSFFMPILAEKSNSGDFFGVIRSVIQASYEFMMVDPRMYHLSNHFLETDERTRESILVYFSFDYGQGFGSLITSAIHSGQIDRHFSADFLIGVLALFFSNIHKLLPPHSSSTEALTTLDQIIDLIQYGILSKKGETE